MAAVNTQHWFSDSIAIQAFLDSNRGKYEVLYNANQLFIKKVRELETMELDIFDESTSNVCTLSLDPDYKPEMKVKIVNYWTPNATISNFSDIFLLLR